MMTLTDEKEELSLLDQEACWRIVLSRDTSLDGVFVTAVRSTGIYCRPGCPARHPLRKNVTFFASPEGARAAGYRACLRCRPDDVSPDGSPDLVHAVCRLLDDDSPERRSVETIADELGVSAHQVQRAFKRALGIAPGQYAEARRLERLKAGLREGRAVTHALYDAGYGSSSRLYEGGTERLGMTPAAYRRGGLGMAIRYEVLDSPLGKLLVAATERGVCSVQFGDSDAQLAASLRREFPAASIEGATGSEWATAIADSLKGRRYRLDIPLDVQATAFQWRVWRALQSIPRGATRSYSDIAREIGAPKAVRAVANACAANHAAIVIPCHRVVRASGDAGGYRYGRDRKQKLLAAEAATPAAAVASG